MQQNRKIGKSTLLPRHKSREFALQILYKMELNPFEPADAALSEEGGLAQLQQEIINHLNHFQVPERLRPFVQELVIGTRTHLAAIDQHIDQASTHWKFSRIDYVDRNLLRMAIYEMVVAQTSPPAVVINEAVEMAKEFATADSASFVNGILDRLREITFQAPPESK